MMFKIKCIHRKMSMIKVLPLQICLTWYLEYLQAVLWQSHYLCQVHMIANNQNILLKILLICIKKREWVFLHFHQIRLFYTCFGLYFAVFFLGKLANTILITEITIKLTKCWKNILKKVFKMLKKKLKDKMKMVKKKVKMQLKQHPSKQTNITILMVSRKNKSGLMKLKLNLISKTKMIQKAKKARSIRKILSISSRRHKITRTTKIYWRLIEYLFQIKVKEFTMILLRNYLMTKRMRLWEMP